MPLNGGGGDVDQGWAVAGLRDAVVSVSVQVDLSVSGGNLQLMSETNGTPILVPTNLPLMNGDTVLDGDGNWHTVASARIVMKFADGSERIVTLEKRDGNQWWVSDSVAD